MMTTMKINVEKRGQIQDYFNKPVLDDYCSNDANTIGHISDAVEFEDAYELTVILYDDQHDKFKVCSYTNNDEIIGLSVK